MVTRLSVNIGSETAATIRELQARDDETATEIIRCAVALYGYFKAADRDGAQIHLRYKSGERARVELL